MKASESIEIAAPIDRVWTAITDIANYANLFSSITDLKILHKPDDGLVGLKWQETRVMFGKEASEEMWIVEAVPNEFYRADSASHGMLYTSGFSVSSHGNQTTLTKSFNGVAQTTSAKIMSALMDVFMKGTVKKCMEKDLADIKSQVENT